MTTKVTRDVFDGSVRPITAIDINGGSIDGTPIGAATPDVGFFTNLECQNLTVTNSADFTGATVSAINAYYADIAEEYRADKIYEPGTVVKLGGSAEITATDKMADWDVFGVISTNPAYNLNHSDDEFMLSVAQIGRVPCWVVGPVKQGQRLMAMPGGVAKGMRWYHRLLELQSFARVIKEDLREEKRLVEVAINTMK